ncbi:hypothetical protein [Paenibacillus dendritiformis]|uniref:hypothetical protein n=1 Tax=Paenibacillus dendritiformis TaxID=130049 RepID=UPI00387E03A9
MSSIWNNEFTLIYPKWEDQSLFEKELVNGSYRDAIRKAKVLAIKPNSPGKGSRREILIYLGDSFLKGIG